MQCSENPEGQEVHNDTTPDYYKMKWWTGEWFDFRIKSVVLLSHIFLYVCKCVRKPTHTFSFNMLIWNHSQRTSWINFNKYWVPIHLWLIALKIAFISMVIFSHNLEILSLSQLSEVSEVAQSCLTLCNPMDCRLPGSSIHGIFQSRILEWVAISFSRGSSQGSNPGLLHYRADTLQSEPTGKSSQLT